MKSSPYRMRWALGLVATIFVIAAWISVRFVEFYRANTLYDAARSGPSGERMLAVERLAARSGEYPTELLLRLARDERPIADINVRVASVSALAKRNQGQFSGPLASMMVPHNAVMLPQSVASALQNTPCSPECVDLLLQYLYRLQAGDGNSEDFYQLAPPSKDFAAEEQEISKKLEEVLIREKPKTLRVLREVYGFESDTPSSFAIHMLGQLHFNEACNSLTRIHIDALRDSATRIELEKTIQLLGCPVRS
jgi:hypothetical protein